MVANQNAILISDADRQQLRDFLQWLRTTRPDLVEQVRNGSLLSQPLSEETNSLWQSFLSYLTVQPDSLHGHYYVTPDLKKSAQATATMMTASNVIDAIGNFSCFFFAFKSLTLAPALFLALAMTGGVLVSANAVSVATSYGHKGRRWLAAAALFLGLIPLNILQTMATGVGVEIFNNQSELAQLRAGDSLNAILQAKEDKLAQAKKDQPAAISECQQEKQALAALPRATATEEKAFQSRYVRLYGTWANQSQPMTLPFEQLPLCVRANRLEASQRQQLQTLTQDIDAFKTQRAEVGNDLALLKQIAPNQYHKIFIEPKPLPFLPQTEPVELRSGIELVSLGTRSFFGKLERGEWEQLGMNLFMFGISASTSLASIGMAVTFALSKEAQRSYDIREKERVDRFFKHMRFTLTALHDEQLRQLDQPENDWEEPDERGQHN
jgi:hypothetical protein